MSDEKWELVERQVELLRSIADKSPGVLDLRLSVNTAANTVELLKDIAQHEKRRAEEAMAALADQKAANAILMHTVNAISLTAKQQRERAETAQAALGDREGELGLSIDVANLRNQLNIARHQRDEAEAALQAAGQRGWFKEYRDVLAVNKQQAQELESLRLRAEAAEHAAAFADTYARYYHEHMLARAAGRESEHPYTFDVWYILSDDVGRRTRALMREGELVVSDSEGGFGPDEISIGGDNMSELIAQWMGLQLNGRGSLAPIKEGRSELGLVRLIMERL